jgi:hypothetical protein
MNIGQLRTTDISSYGEIKSYSVSSRSVAAAGSNYYSDTLLKMDKALDSSLCYCLTVTFKKAKTKQTINIRLKSRTKEDDYYQNIKTINISETSSTNETISHTVIFQPNMNYDQIVFVLNRNENDLVSSNGVLGRTVEIVQTDTKVYSLVNIIDQLKSRYSNFESMKQIGVRGESGLPMCINGEEIRIGPSGVYEINNGTEITYLGFAIIGNSSSSKNSFILDFLY